MCNLLYQFVVAFKLGDNIIFLIIFNIYMVLFTREDKKREIHLLPQAARKKKRKVTKEK